MVLEKTLESPLNCKAIKPVNPKGNLSWRFIERTDAGAETPVLWPPDGKNQLIGKDLMLERLKAGGEGDNRGWAGWMASLTQWTWVWVSSRSWWWQGSLTCCSPDQIRLVTQSCPTLCNPMNHSTPGLPVHRQLPEFTETHVHLVSDAISISFEIQPSHPLSSPSPPAPNSSQHQSLFQWVNSSHEVAKVLEFQL